MLRSNRRLAHQLGNVERIKTLLEDGSQPKFQTLTLLQLPNELLSLILRNAGIAEARLLAATCTLLRALALPFVFQVSDIFPAVFSIVTLIVCPVDPYLVPTIRSPLP